MNKRLTISVVGCGWLGLPLAESLILRGYRLKGSTTTANRLKELEKKGIDPYLVHFGEKSLSIASHLLDCDVLIIAIPPGSRTPEGAGNYRLMADFFTSRIPETKIGKVILISSTAVYPESNSLATETSEAHPETAGGRLLKNVEDQFLCLPGKNVIVLRLAGLVGPDRHAGRFFKGRKGISNGLAPVNLIHRDDVTGIIEKIIENEQATGIYNLCSPTHPSKAEFYSLAAIAVGEPIPEFISEKGNWKIISGKRVTDELGYQFIYPNLEDWLRETGAGR